MHRHIEWDDPGKQSVLANFANDPDARVETGPGDILSARYQRHVIRVKVEAYRKDDAVSIGKVVAIINPQGQRLEHVSKLTLGDYVRLPDEKRAFEPQFEDEEEKD
ncbi:hypothetical protein [Vreelandella massiliensis]|uniref:hypothetical protein n=1 Tax=Vreelandella massiliensis TaxID=1816686 RepID=UPI00096A9409|nr:hypothetical protein [Halomonas massiliensis]